MSGLVVEFRRLDSLEKAILQRPGSPSGQAEDAARCGAEAPLDVGPLPLREPEMRVGDLHDALPADGSTTVHVEPEVGSAAGKVEIVAADVAGGDWLKERATRHVGIHRGKEAERTQRAQIVTRDQLRNEDGERLAGARRRQAARQVRIENEDLVAEIWRRAAALGPGFIWQGHDARPAL